jgi:hypothetical protein
MAGTGNDASFPRYHRVFRDKKARSLGRNRSGVWCLDGKYSSARMILFLRGYGSMRIVLSLVSAFALYPTLTVAGPRDAGRTRTHRVHFVTGIHWAHSPYRGYHYFNGLSWGAAPLVVPYGGLPLNGDFIYRGREVSDDVYPYAIPTANPDIVISPFALNNLVNVAGIPPGARVRDPVSEEIFLRP